MAGQASFFSGLRWYLILLIAAAYVSFAFPTDAFAAITSASLFLITLGILVFIRVRRPDDIWYNGRAVAESVKIRSWRWMMRAGPYEDCENIEVVRKEFISDLKSILEQNKSLSDALQSTSVVNDPISNSMVNVRGLPISERLELYVTQRIQNQINWYWLKSGFNKRRAQQWFWVSVSLHSIAILMLLYRIKEPAFSLPVEVVATAAGAALTWLQAKKTQ